MIRLVKKSDIDILAKIYKDLYDNVDIGENWSIEKSKDLLNYWYEKQKDLFFVVVENDIPVGAIVSGIKSWFDGLRLIDTEIFVSKESQGKHLAKKLMFEHLKKAKLKYNAKIIEFHTYGEESEFPQNWYNRIGFKKDDELIIMHGDVEDILNKLGYNENDYTTIDEEKDSYIKTMGYNELSDIYCNLKEGDVAYIFDMLPEYSYVDNYEERKYLESRNIAISNGALINLFIIGSKEKFDNLSKNVLFKNTLESNKNIVLLSNDELKEKCLDEFLQLGNGLYFGKKSNGDVELFRDLFTSFNNIGMYYKNNEINFYIEEKINNILNKVNSGELKNYYDLYSK